MVRALLLALVVVSADAAADCSDWGWKVFPEPGSTVPTNARFLLQGYGLAQEAVAKLASRKPRLVAEGQRFPLDVVEVHVGEKEITQAVLKPRGALTPGTRYTLQFDQPGEEVRFSLGNAVPNWTAGPGPDFEPPTWTEPPSAGPGRIVQYGCGPLEEAQVKLSLKDASPVLVRARVKDSTDKVREYLLTPKDGLLAVGHSMCSGAFLPGEGEWTLELTAIDVAHNSTPAPGAPLRFKGVEPLN